MAYKNFFIFVLINVLFASYVYSQTDSSKVQFLNKIFSNLEYNTIAYNDLKVKWVISDPDLVRDVFNRFIVNDALRIDGKHVSKKDIKEKAKFIFDGKVVLDLRKRYYDNEIEFFAFITEDQLNEDNPIYLFDPILDGFYLREIINRTLYSILQDKEYYFLDITKTVYDVKPGYFFDINLNLIEPELMFWSTTSNYRNKYLLSLVGKWGTNDTYFPGWYSDNYFVGIQVKYYDFLKSDPYDYTYKVMIGTGLSAGAPFQSALPTMPLKKTWSNIYFHLSGDALKNVSELFKGLYLNISGSLAYQKLTPKEIGLIDSTVYYSTPDFFNFSLTKRKLFNIFDFGYFLTGLGVSTHSEKKYQYIPGSIQVNDIDNKDFFDLFNHVVYANFGIEKYGGLIQHHLIFNVAYSVSNDFIGVGADVKFMISDLLGFRIIYNKFMGVDFIKQPYRTETQIVFSPIFRINY